MREGFPADEEFLQSIGIEPEQFKANSLELEENDTTSAAIQRKRFEIDRVISKSKVALSPESERMLRSLIGNSLYNGFQPGPLIFNFIERYENGESFDNLHDPEEMYKTYKEYLRLFEELDNK
jgi:hypothetical protein